ncbi:MAG: hypothetical protein ACC661_01240 [Verrucomicrobiales bacterium]
MSFLKKTALVLFLLGILGIAATETALWLRDPQPDYPPVQLLLASDFPGLRPLAEYALNEEGLRTINWSAGGKKPGALRVLFIGGGTTDLFMHGAGDTWWGRAVRLVSEASNVEIEAAAFGTGPPLILDGARWLQQHGEELEADLVVVDFGLGDVLNEGTEYIYDPDRFERLGVDERSAWEKFAERYSQTFRYLRVRKLARIFESRRALMSRPGYIDGMLKQRREDYAKLPEIETLKREAAHDPLLEYLDGIDHLVDIGQRSGIALLILGEPLLHGPELGPESRSLLRVSVRTGPDPGDLGRPDPAWVDAQAARFYAAGAGRAASHGVAFASLHGRIPRSAEAFLDDSLLTVEGCARMGEAVAPMILELVHSLPVASPGEP